MSENMYLKLLPEFRETSFVLTDDGLWPLWQLFVKGMDNTRFMSWNGALTNLFESPCNKLVITLTRDAYGKFNSRALTRTWGYISHNHHVIVLWLSLITAWLLQQKVCWPAKLTNDAPPNKSRTAHTFQGVIVHRVESL